MRLIFLPFLIIGSLFFTSMPLSAQGPAQAPNRVSTQAPARTSELEKLENFLAKTQKRGDQLAPPSDDEAAYPDLSSQAALLVFLALLPFMVMLLTSFLKMVITLALLRSALGVQQTPPNQVINGIALILSFYVMYPTGLEMYNRAKHILEQDTTKKLFSANSAAVTIAVINEAKEPLRDFLIRNTQKNHLEGFYKLAHKTFPPEAAQTLQQTDFIVAVPSFITSQIRSAFEIGILIYLPFFVIDLVTSNVLLAMQMMMLSPLSISLPLKLLLVVMIDGWTILVQGLVLSFK